MGCCESVALEIDGAVKEFESVVGNKLIPGIPVKARVWRLPDATYPELKFLPDWEARDDVGLAIEGGGLRAVTMSLGVLAALEAMGYMRRLRYMASISGSSPTMATLSYLPEDYSVAIFFGGAASDPKSLTPEALASAPEGSYLKTLFKLGDLNFKDPAADIAAVAVNQTIEADSHLRLYNEAITGVIFSDFGLWKYGAVMSMPVGTEPHQRAVAATSSANVCVQSLRQSMPFHIIGGSRLIKSDGSNSQWCSIEFTPLYCGTPINLPDAPGGPVGGGVVESFGFGSAAPASLPSSQGNSTLAVGNEEEVEVSPRTFYPMVKAAGTSSADLYTADLVKGFIEFPAKSPWMQRMLGGPTAPEWSPADIASGNNKQAVMGDGGPTDPCGLLALLRRRVSKVIVQCCDGFDILTTQNPADSTWWAAYFGAVSQSALNGYGQSPEHMNAQCKVFDTSALQPLVDKLVTLGNAGKPMAVDLTLPVLENRLCGVQGGWEVQLLWLFPGVPDAFKNALPTQTQALLASTASGSTGPFGVRASLCAKNFPYSPSFALYTPELTRMIVEVMAFNLMDDSTRKQLNSFFGPGKSQ